MHTYVNLQSPFQPLRCCISEVACWLLAWVEDHFDNLVF